MYRLAPIQNVSESKKENIYPLTVPLSANRNLCFASSWLTGRHEFSPRTCIFYELFQAQLTMVNTPLCASGSESYILSSLYCLVLVNVMRNRHRNTVGGGCFCFVPCGLKGTSEGDFADPSSRERATPGLTWHWRRTQGSAGLCHLKELL